jgi:2-dehydro-3-deoxyglucarate aldolase
MNRVEAIKIIRDKLKKGQYSIGSWMQIPHSSVAEIMGDAGYDWVAVDLEHGSISVSQLPDLFRALELGNTLPLARLARGHPKDCKQALDAGAGGVIVPMVESVDQVIAVREACRWPPAGSRGVGFSRANMFGKYFNRYSTEAQNPLLIVMIENERALEQLDNICKVDGLDALLVGPYDLSASMGITAEFNSDHFVSTMKHIKKVASASRIACGVHVVDPSINELQQRLKEGYQFLAYSIDSIFLVKEANINLS